jgi:hypothetical protein
MTTLLVYCQYTTKVGCVQRTKHATLNKRRLSLIQISKDTHGESKAHNDLHIAAPSGTSPYFQTQE